MVPSRNAIVMKGNPMKTLTRRGFLGASAAALALLHPAARAALNHQHFSSLEQASGGLLPLEAMPKGQPLALLPLLKNQSRSKGVFKARITAKPHQLTVAARKTTEFWLYNGQLPGPQIVVREGDEVEILFENQLPEPTTVHWHGLPVPPDQDGNPQDFVPPGGKRWYRFTLSEDCAGTYWYHPHPHGLTAMQVARGLAGTFVVLPKTPSKVDKLVEQHWLISDLRLDTQAQVPDNTLLDWLNGREGHFVLINGQREPQIDINNCSRIRIWNACAARYLRLHIPGVEWQLLGTDGGLIEEPHLLGKELLLAPGERVEVIAHCHSAQQAPLVSHYYDRDKMMVNEPHTAITLAQVHHSAGESFALPQKLRDFPKLPKTKTTKHVVFSEAPMDHHSMSDMPRSELENMFFVNGRVYHPERMDLVSYVGEWEHWQLVNNSHMDHPFHLHGTQFLVTHRERGGENTAEPVKAWRDTVNLRPQETVHILVQQTMPGIRMFHCHILEHEDLGMMANLHVIAKQTTAGVKSV